MSAKRNQVLLQTGSSRAIIYKSEMEFISRCILDSKHIETGGELFGFWTMSGAPVVLYAIGPGPRANHQTTFFNQDTKYLNEVGGEIVKRFGLHHIGEWHSHHQLGLARPSGHDASTMKTSIRKKGLQRFLCCIGNCTETKSTLNAFLFTDSTDYERVLWEIKDIDSPFRSVIDAELGNKIILPRTVIASYNVDSVPLSKPSFPKDYWFEEKDNRLQFKKISDFIERHNPECTSEITLDEDGLIHIEVNGDDFSENILFPIGFPKTNPVMFRRKFGIQLKTADKVWNPGDNLLEAFINYYTDEI